jgi:ABC-type uncharacterized transport system involved in gliding motility auxiliary subunit
MKRTFWYSSLGVVLLVIAFLAVNLLVGRLHGQVDLTQGALFTLSDATRTVVQKLDKPVRLRFYFTRNDATVPIQVRVFARRVEDLLAGYKSLGGDRIVIERLDPEPDSDAEDQASLDGVQAQTTQTGERFFLGLVIDQGDHKTAIPALDGNREALLEYDITRAITRVSVTDKPVVGILSPLPLAGNPMAQMMGQPPQPAQVIYSQLEQDYTVKMLPMDSASIPAEIKLLLVIHPRGITERTEFAIDQYVLRGGRLVAFLDPLAYFDQRPSPMGMMPGGPSNLEHLLTAWGYALDTKKVVLDLENAAGSGTRVMPTVLALDGAAINPRDVATSAVPNLLIPMAGAFTGKPAAGLTQTVLLKSSKQSQLVDSADASRQGREALRGFTGPSGEEYAMAIRLAGRFRTAFPDGRPAAPVKPDEGKGKGAKAAPAAESARTEAASEPALTEGTGENNVVLVADSDFLNDGAAVSIQELFGRRIVIPSNGNLPFFTALVEQMAGDPALAKLSSRAVSTRPLTVVKRMETEATQAYLGKLKSLEDSLNETREKLKALQGAGQPGAAGAPGAVLTPEQQTEIDAFRRKSVDTRRELKQVRKDLRADTEALEFWTKMVNIALMPVIVALAGLGFALSRRRRSPLARRPAAA